MDAERQQASIEAVWGSPSDPATLAELIRVEVTARRSCARAWALHRVVDAVHQLTEVDVREQLDDLCHELERIGDLNLAPGGRLHTTPLRAVELDPLTFRLVGSVPTHILRAALPGTLVSLGATRRLEIDGADADNLPASVGDLGGIVLSPERWSSLARTPVADVAWLETLDDRLRWHPESVGGLDRHGPRDWMALQFTDDQRRWRRSPTAPARLWRSKDAWGRWSHAWVTEGHSPATASFVSLTPDDGTRTLFALARSISAPIRAEIDPAEPNAVLGIPEWLPRAEYRYLAALSVPSAGQSPSEWAVPRGRVDVVQRMLEERLGLVFGKAVSHERA